jgi:hypothetical protein
VTLPLTVPPLGTAGAGVVAAKIDRPAKNTSLISIPLLLLKFSISRTHSFIEESIGVPEVF